MVDLTTVVWNTSLHVRPSTDSLPKPLMFVFSGFYRVHRFWRMYRKAEIYSNPQNFVSLASGHALNYVAGDRVLVRMSALAVLIANRIMMVVNQIFQLQNSVRKLQNSFRDEYSKVINYKLVKTNFFSSTTLSEAKYRFRRGIEKIKRVIINFFMMLKDTFLLSMRMIDAIEAFYMSPDTREEGINEVFVNGFQLLGRLEDNRKELQSSLKKSKPIIDDYLTAIGSQFTADKFIEISSEALDTVSDVHAAAQEITNPLVQIVQEFGKRLIYGYGSIFGFKKLIPKRFHPNYKIAPRIIDPAFHFAPERVIKMKKD